MRIVILYYIKSYNNMNDSLQINNKNRLLNDVDISTLTLVFTGCRMIVYYATLGYRMIVYYEGGIE